jgi:hypothetical protein
VSKQGDRTFSSWHAVLSADVGRTQPTVRLEEILNKHRAKV